MNPTSLIDRLRLSAACSDRGMSNNFASDRKLMLEAAAKIESLQHTLQQIEELHKIYAKEVK